MLLFHPHTTGVHLISVRCRRVRQHIPVSPHIVPESAHRRLEPCVREVSAGLFVHPPAFRIALPLVERTFAVEIHIGENARGTDIVDHKSLSPDLSVRILRLDLKNARLSGVGRLSLRFSRVPVQCILKCSTFFYSSKRH